MMLLLALVLGSGLAGCDLLGQSEVHMLVTRVDDPKRGSVTPMSRQFTHGAKVEISARPATSTPWIFSHWSGDLESTDNPATFTIKRDMEVMAHFRLPDHTLSIVVEGGGRVEHRPAGSSRERSGEAEVMAIYGSEIQVRAIPDPGWRFVRWRGKNFTFNRTNNPAVVAVWEDQTLIAIFEPIE